MRRIALLGGLLSLGLGLAAPRPGMAQDLVEYGQYLATECSTCHRLNAFEGAIPPLGHIPEDYFIVAMKEYRSGRRDNPAMVSVANALNDQEIEALAAYYAALREAE